MKTDETEALLESMKPEIAGIRASLGRRGDAVYLLLESDEIPGKWVVVETPGDRWFSVQTEGNYSVDCFAEGFSNEEVRITLEEYVGIGISYLCGASEAATSGLWRTPVLRVRYGDELVEMRQSAVANLKALARRLFGRGNRSL